MPIIRPWCSAQSSGRTGAGKGAAALGEREENLRAKQPLYARLRAVTARMSRNEGSSSASFASSRRVTARDSKPLADRRASSSVRSYSDAHLKAKA